MRISDWSSDVCSSDLAGARVAVLAGEARRGARVDRLFGLARQIFEHLLLGPHRLGVAPHGEMAVAQRLLAHFERASLGLPLGEPAVEQRDIVRAEQFEKPPGARRALPRAELGSASCRESMFQYV